MTAAAYSTNLSNIFTDGNTTGWTALGGGASGLNQETDYYIQGTSCLSKNAFASSEKGMIYNYGSDAGGTPTDGAYLMWVTHLTPNSLDTIAGGGIKMLIGSGTGDYKSYYVAGSDTIEFGGWVLAAVKEQTTGDQADTGTPSSTVEQYFGALFDLPTGGPTKGAPNGIDAIRYGRCDIVVEHGTGADPEATFSGILSNLETSTNRYGLLALINGAYFNSGLLQLGSSTNAVEFSDSNKTIFLRDHPHVSANFHTWEVQNASSVITFENLVVSALGTTTKGRWVTTNNATLNWTNNSWTDMNTFGFQSNATITGNTFRRCGTVTTAGATMSGCNFDSSPAASSVIATSPANASLISNSTFTSDGNGNGLEITGTAANFTLTNVDFSGYSATVDADKPVYVNIASGSVTITVSGGSGLTAASQVRTAGATVTVNADTTITFTGMKDYSEVLVQKVSDGSEIASSEDHTDGQTGTTDNRSFAWSAPATTEVRYIIHNWDANGPDYETIRVNSYTVPSNDTSIAIAQRIDRNSV